MEAAAYLTMTNVAPEEWAARVDETVRVIGRSRRARFAFLTTFRASPGGTPKSGPTPRGPS